jgi:hypothetical protein
MNFRNLSRNAKYTLLGASSSLAVFLFYIQAKTNGECWDWVLALVGVQ